MRMYYTVYDARTDEVLAFGNATQCAATLGCANARIFHSIVSKAWHGKIKKIRRGGGGLGQGGDG